MPYFIFIGYRQKSQFLWVWCIAVQLFCIHISLRVHLRSIYPTYSMFWLFVTTPGFIHDNLWQLRFCFFALVGPTHHAHWATMGAKYTSVETTWNPYPYAYRMRTAIASSVKFLPCILKKIKCEYFLQSVPSHQPPPPPLPTSEQMGPPEALSSMDNSYFWPKKHLYTLWFGCTTSTSREDNDL